MDVCGKRVTVMGLGRHGGGVAVARYLAERGARVTVTDAADAETLQESLEALSGVPLDDVYVGGHRQRDFIYTDVIVVNPAVRPENRFVELARRSGARLTSEIELFVEACPARLVGVTGSNGKSTTAAMTAAILEADGRRAWLGGNIGRSLLAELPRMSHDDWVVLELSSFQLARWPRLGRNPDVAIVTNCTPNHLDWHLSFTDYAAAKQRLLLGQSANSLTVLNQACGQVRGWRKHVQGRLLREYPDRRVPTLRVLGAHNRKNAQLAAAAAAGVGCSMNAIEHALANYCGLPHRLELVADGHGRQFYNDSQATTPESTIAALAAFGRPVWLLAGGHDKGCDLAPLAAAITRRARGAAFYGALRHTLAGLVAREPASCEHSTYETLDEAFVWAWSRSAPGDAILLSPAAASFDQFRDYAERAERFGQLVVGALARQRDESHAARC